MGGSQYTKTQPLAAWHRWSCIPFFKIENEGMNTSTHCHVIDRCSSVFGLPYYRLKVEVKVSLSAEYPSSFGGINVWKNRREDLVPTKSPTLSSRNQSLQQWHSIPTERIGKRGNKEKLEFNSSTLPLLKLLSFWSTSSWQQQVSHASELNCHIWFLTIRLTQPPWSRSKAN